MYQSMEYEKRENDFSNISHVNTTLRYGDLSVIPNPWITVFIPTYRRVKLLREALNSVLRQNHCDFAWDIIVLDNEPDNGEVNETERLIRKINHPRILYYRNSENVRPGDNFNRGLQIARGEWVTFCHDDDLLVGNALRSMGKLLSAYGPLERTPLGAISAKYIKFNYDEKNNRVFADISGMDRFLRSQPVSYELYRLTHRNIWFTANIGGDIPSNGTTFNRKAALECGGFIEDFGISGDLILFYRLENNYRVYSTFQPLGFYRWGANSMAKPESTRRTIKDGFDFREYVYSRNFLTKFLGNIVRSVQNRLFTTEVVNMKNDGVDKDKQIKLCDYLLPGIELPNKLWYAIYVVLIRKAYFLYKKIEAKRVGKKAYKYEVEHNG